MTSINGKSFGKYNILSEIGKGGMGEVYLAQDANLNRKVAIKFLSKEFSKDSEKLNRFIQEAQATSALNHPNILTVYEIDEFEGKRYIATEFIEGETLRDTIGNKESVPLNQILKIGIQTAEALSAAHSAGIAHRDIKPENIMIRADGYVKVLDFGLAKLTEKNKPEDDISLEGKTKVQVKTNPGVVMGTVSYMSPEQAQGKVTDERTDIWSLGVVLYEMLAGKVPFEGKTLNHTIVAILETEPKLLDNVPNALQRIVRKALTKEKENRYQTARDLLIDLKNLKHELKVQGEIERSIIPNKDPGTTAEHDTQVYADQSIEETDASVREPLTQNVTTASSLEYAVTQARGHKLFSVAVAIVLLGAISAIGYFAFYADEGSDQIESIAVMPFVNESGDKDVEYLSDGMTETLISSLSKLPNLNVKPRSTVFRFKGKEINPQTIGKELNVQAILNGRVVQRLQDISLFVELIDVSLDKVVWSEQYKRKQSDLVSLQSEIARDVSRKLKTKLSGADEANVTKAYTTNPEAYQLYLKGNYYRKKYNEQGYKKGIEYYKQALEIDPNYALAYSGISQAYDLSSDWYLPPSEAMPKAKAAALKALELDNSLAETHLTLGWIAYWYEWDWITTQRELKRAMEIDPASIDSTNGWYLATMGRMDEALKQMITAQRLAPLDLQINIDLAYLHHYEGHYDKAIDQARKTLEIDPNYWFAHQVLGLIYERKKQFPEAIAALEKARSLDPSPEILGYLGYAYAAAGKKAEARKALDELKELSKQRYVSPYNIAVIYAGLNDKDQAFEWLNKAYDARSIYMPFLKFDTVYDNLRSDPRFGVLLKRMNFPD